MPAKHSIKEYEAGAYYHLYNRGVEKRIVFQDDADYKTFLGFLRLYLTAPHLPGDSRKVARPISKPLNNFQGNIILLAYCLMPNHFHLLVKQNQEDGINHFMRSLMAQYVRYFNTKYQRIGSLFQGPYKAVKVESEEQFVYLSKYIHRNPLDLPAFRETPGRLDKLENYKFSSYGNYLNLFQQSWVSCSDILSYFSTKNPQTTYKTFIKESTDKDILTIAPLTIDIEFD